MDQGGKMGRISWSFYSNRRGARLSAFLRGIDSVSGAIDKFIKLGIVPPMDLIHEFYNTGGTDNNNESKKEVSLSKNEKSNNPEESMRNEVATASSTEGYDDLIIISSEKEASEN